MTLILPFLAPGRPLSPEPVSLSKSPYLILPRCAFRQSLRSTPSGAMGTLRVTVEQPAAQPSGTK